MRLTVFGCSLSQNTGRRAVDQRIADPMQGQWQYIDAYSGQSGFTMSGLARPAASSFHLLKLQACCTGD